MSAISPIVSLPMYDWPEVRAATDELWRGIARHLSANGFGDVTTTLDRETPLEEQWRSPRLLLSQTCGYPLVHALAGRVALVATPSYAAPGCEGALYSSHIVVRRGSGLRRLSDLRGRVAVYNNPDSMSGMLALKAVVAPFAENGRFFAEVVESGAHARSLEAVAKAEADVAAIDCVSFAIARRHRRDVVDELEVIAGTPKVPGLPFVTALGRPAPERARLARALAEAFADPRLAAVREELFIAGLEFPGLAPYQRILELESAADAAGYTRLA